MKNDMKKEFRIKHWTASNKNPPVPGATLSDFRVYNHNEGHDVTWKISLSAEELLSLSEHYDIMISGGDTIFVNDLDRKFRLS